MTLREVKCFLNNPQNIKCQGKIIQLVTLKYALFYIIIKNVRISTKKSKLSNDMGSMIQFI